MRNLAIAASRLDGVLGESPGLAGGQSIRRGESLAIMMAK